MNKDKRNKALIVVKKMFTKRGLSSEFISKHMKGRGYMLYHMHHHKMD